jgi:hypothetical protein
MIIAKSISANNDTITYISKQIYPASKMDTLQYFNLDSPVWLDFDTPVTAPYFNIDTSRLNDGRITNTLNYNNNFFPNSVIHYCKYGEGLGIMDTTFDYILYPLSDGINVFSGQYHKTLIYASQGIERYGAPYYESNGSNLTHFTPIPEDCAYWNYDLNTNGSLGVSQLRTGNKIYMNSHTYIELLYRTFLNNQISGDSLVGYFRNDTAGSRVYLTLHPGGSETLLYDFTIHDSADAGPNYYSVNVDTINIGGKRLTEWDEERMDPLGDIYYHRYIEGIGFIYNEFFNDHDYGCYVTDANSYEECRVTLSSFCVCGNTLYPDTASRQCELLTGITDIHNSQTDIRLYPNPTSDILYMPVYTALTSSSPTF